MLFLMARTFRGGSGTPTTTTLILKEDNVWIPVVARKKRKLEKMCIRDSGGPTGLTSVADFSAAAAAVWGLELMPSPTAGMKISSTPGTAGTPTSGNVARVRPTNIAYHPRIHA